MKILQFINSLAAGGAEKLIVDATIEYHKRGIPVDLLLISKGNSPFLERLNEFDAIKVFYLGEDVDVYNPKYIFKLNAYFKKYDIVHVHLFPAMYWAAFAKIFGKKPYKLIFTEHNSTNRRMNNPFFKLLDKWVYTQFDNLITISDAVDAALRGYLGSSFKNITKIYNGINLVEIKEALPYSKHELGFSDNNILILQVSRFFPQKDQATLIRAMVDLPKHIVLLLVGSGPLMEEHKQLAKNLNLEDKVFFLGVRRDVPRLLKSVDYVVLSSHFEGLSLSSVEGLASGKPFIASDVPGLTEVVQGAGFLFPDRNEKKLTEILLGLQKNPKLYEETVEACITRSKTFDINNMVDNYLKLYSVSLKK